MNNFEKDVLAYLKDAVNVSEADIMATNIIVGYHRGLQSTLNTKGKLSIETIYKALSVAIEQIGREIKVNYLENNRQEEEANVALKNLAKELVYSLSRAISSDKKVEGGKLKPEGGRA